ncbi:hypothetical protein RV040_004843 [Vibrio alginolyticus]|nr:hypothetical protein [Vibrio alginolyticus]
MEACKSFPDSRLIENEDLAIKAIEEIMDTDSRCNLSVDEAKLIVLKEKYALNECANECMANYYKVTAYYYFSCFDGAGADEEIKTALTNANKFTSGAQLPTKAEFQKIKKEAKQKNRQLRKEVMANNKRRIEQEKVKILHPIRITSTQFSVALTLISTLFFISGFLYTKVFFHWFDINVGDFYTVQDYVSSSIDVISTTAMSALTGLLSVGYGVIHGFNNVLWEGQFDTKEKKKDYILPLAVFTSLLLVVLFIYETGTFPSKLLIPVVLAAILFISNRISIWKYIENKIPVMAVCVVIVFFFLHLGIQIKDNIEEVKGNDYGPPYALNFKEGYEKYEKMSFVTSNSNYVFLLNKESKSVEIVPKNSVISFEVNKDL